MWALIFGKSDFLGVEEGEEVFATVFEEVEDVVEAVDAVIIGVGDVVSFRVMYAEIAHAGDLFFCLNRRGGIMQVGDVVVVHAYDEIEIVEIRRSYDAAAVVEMEAVLIGRRTHTSVG